jgi:hypothetical protein
VKKSYDVIGLGEGLAGLVACSLLASRKLRCLWVDTTPGTPGRALWPDTPLLLTEAFFQGILVPVFSLMDPHMVARLNVQRRIPVRLAEDSRGPQAFPPGQVVMPHASRSLCEQYLSLLRTSLVLPGRYLRRLGRAVDHEPWELALVGVLGCTGAGRVSRWKAHAAAMGMSAVAAGTVRAVLQAWMATNRSECVMSTDAQILVHGRDVVGFRLEDSVHTGQRYLAEDMPQERRDRGFHLYGQCRSAPGMKPFDNEELLIVTPPPELNCPIAVKTARDPDAPAASIYTRVISDPGLTSSTETVSWASGMVVKRLSRVLPSLAQALQTFEAVDPLQEGAVRPWFRFTRDTHAPSLFGVRRYIRPLEKLFAIDRDKYACLGDDGDFFWGICIANAILKDLGRSDLFASTGA